MSEVKFNNSKFVIDANGLKITNDNADFPERNVLLDHDGVDSTKTIGVGNDMVNCLMPTTLVDDGYFDLAADSAGFGKIMVGNREEHVLFTWARDNTVTLVDNSTNVASTDSDTDFCIFDNTDNVRIKNRLGSAKKVIWDIHYTEVPIAPTFQVFSAPSGVDNLDPNLTINGTTVTPTFRYKGGDADATDLDAWTYGSTLVLTQDGSGGSINYNDGSPGLGDNDDAFEIDPVNATNGKFYAASTQFGGIGTDDYVFEWVGTLPEAGTLVSKIDGSGDGWRLEATTGPIFRWRHDPGSHILVDSATLTLGAWYHVLVFGDRSGSAQIYVNGVASGSPVAISGGTGSLDATANLAIGANNESGVGLIQHKFAYCALWNSAAWLDTHLQATVASERFAKLCGYYPQYANGTYLPTTKARASGAYLDKIENEERKFYYVGDNWLRMCHREDSTGEDVRGYLAETQNQNLITYSEAFTNWTKIDAGDTVNDSASVCPDGRTAASDLIADATDGVHGLSLTATLTAATYSFSVYAKPGNVNFIRLLDGTLGGVNCYFDIANGTVESCGANADGYIEGPFYNGFYRCCIVFTGIASSNTFIIRAAEADGDDTLQGDGVTVNLTLWGAQVEQSDYMTSPIVTTGSALTRLGDQLIYAAGDNIGGQDVGQGTVAFDCLFPNYDKTKESSYFYWIGDGSASGERVYGQPTVADKFLPGTRGTNGSGNPGDPGAPDVDIVDGVKHSIRHTYETNSTIAYVDGTAGTEDTTCDIPDAVDTMYFAQNNATVLQPNCLIQNFRIYNEPWTKG